MTSVAEGVHFSVRVKGANLVRSRSSLGQNVVYARVGYFFTPIILTLVW